MPSADVAIVALTNATPSGVPETLTAEFADLVQFGEVREDWRKLYEKAFADDGGADRARWSASSRPPTPRPSAPLASYVGTYANATGVRPRVTEKDGKLCCRLGHETDVPLKHWDGNVFTFSAYRRTRRPERFPRRRSTATTLTLEYYDHDGDGDLHQGR